MMLTKEECENALDNILCNIGVARSDYRTSGKAKEDYHTLKSLIEEHFSNPPLKFEELEEGMWVWDNYWEEYFEISEVYSNTKEIDVLIHQNKINQKRYATIRYTPNRFYRKQVEE